MASAVLLGGLSGCGNSDEADKSSVEESKGCEKDNSCDVGAEAANPRSLIGQKAPDVAGPNVTGAGEIALTDFSDTPMAVVFWVNVCPHCVATMPKVDALQAKFGSRAKILSVAIHDPAADGEGDDGFENPEAAVATMQLSIPTIVLERKKADSDWRLAHVPTAFILDAAHNVVDVIEPDDKGTDIVGPLEKALEAAS